MSTPLINTGQPTFLSCYITVKNHYLTLYLFYKRIILIHYYGNANRHLTRDPGISTSENQAVSP